MSKAEAVAMVWEWCVPLVGFLGFGAVVLLGLGLLRRV